MSQGVPLSLILKHMFVTSQLALGFGHCLNHLVKYSLKEALGFGHCLNHLVEYSLKDTSLFAFLNTSDIVKLGQSGRGHFMTLI